jgi:hypothetical protein
LLLHNFAGNPGVPFSTKVSPKAIASRFNQAKLSENPYPRMPVGAPDKAASDLGWRAQVWLPELVAIMAEADDRRLRDGKPLT